MYEVASTILQNQCDILYVYVYIHIHTYKIYIFVLWWKPGEGKWHNLCVLGTVNRYPVSGLCMLCDAQGLCKGQVVNNSPNGAKTLFIFCNVLAFAAVSQKQG